MASRRQLDSIWTIWPDVTALLKEWKSYIERADSWSWGPGFHVHDGDAVRTVNFDPEPPAKYAKTTTGGITARSGSTLGTGNIVLEERTGGTVSDGATEVCYSNMPVAIPHPTSLVVVRDGSAYALVTAYCTP